jgi:hypothetical protein
MWDEAARYFTAKAAATPSDGGSPELFTGCPIVNRLLKTPGDPPGCAFLGMYKACKSPLRLPSPSLGLRHIPPHLRVCAVQTRVLSNWTAVMDQKMPVDPSGLQPWPLADLRPPPMEISPELKAAERPTYYWLWRVGMTLYHYSSFFPTGAKLIDPVAPGWTTVGVTFRDADPARLTAVTGDKRLAHTPCVITLAKDGTVVIVVRGTIHTSVLAYL